MRFRIVSLKFEIPESVGHWYVNHEQIDHEGNAKYTETKMELCSAEEKNRALEFWNARTYEISEDDLYMYCIDHSNLYLQGND